MGAIGRSKITILLFSLLLKSKCTSFRLLSGVLELIFNDYFLDVFDPWYKRRVFTEPF